VKELAASGVPVAVACRVLKLSRQPYYRWLTVPITDAEVLAGYRANALVDAHGDDPEFGHRLMADRTAWAIASANGWWSRFGKKRAKNGNRSGHRCTTTCAPWSTTTVGSGTSSSPWHRTSCG